MHRRVLHFRRCKARTKGSRLGELGESLFERTTHLDAEDLRRRRAEVDLLQFHPHNSPWLRVKLLESLGDARPQVPGTAREKIGGKEDKRTKDVQ